MDKPKLIFKPLAAGKGVLLVNFQNLVEAVVSAMTSTGHPIFPFFSATVAVTVELFLLLLV